MSPNFTYIDFAIFLIYILLIVGLGIYSSRKTSQSKRDYFLAGDKLPWWMVGGSIIAANISSHQLVGVMGVAYDRGFVAMVVEWGAILIGFNALLWIFLPFYLRNGFYTMPEFLQRRFGTGAKTIYAVLVLLTYIFVEIAAVLYLGALTMQAMLGIPIWTCVLILAVTTGIYTILGGLKAVIWTEMVQLAVLIIGMIALSYTTIDAAGGFSAVLETTKDWKLIMPADDPDFPWTMYLGGLLCISIFYNATNQFIVQRTLAAKNEWHARMGIIFGDYLKFIIPLLIVFPALVAVKLFPDLDKPDLLFSLLVENLLPTGLVGLVMAGLIAAVMSHLSGAINSCTTILTIDIYIPFMNKNATERESVNFGKISGVVIVVLGIICSGLIALYSEKPIFIYLMSAYGYFTPGIATMFLLGILWKGTTHTAAVFAGLLTIPLSVALEFAYPELSFFNRTGIVFWVCMVSSVLVSLVTKKKEEKELVGLIWNRSSLRLSDEDRYLQRGFRNPTLWWGIITVIVLFFYIKFA
ncbi:sodium/solute symporter [Sphingobacterium sp. DK4209]|uniref:Sodium/solute symporter n=1 Tax=Sphingobacterium zhuxiongii TaxID=2662364 RepID=A0A5Q0QGG9_9SPHI|nr:MULTISPECIES: sodium/solute symporter [unclassified Sphingobacterium]MVZ64680.1 sodium/solute symporter [Sphingobacterium sp. DK4209]QGA27018.1 sodium/solute symporter [Sphingobacterium sp. dk4302]